MNRFLRGIRRECLHVRPVRKQLPFGASDRFRREETGDHFWAAVNHGVLPGLRTLSYLRFCHCDEVRVGPEAATRGIYGLCTSIWLFRSREIVCSLTASACIPQTYTSTRIGVQRY